MLEQAREFGPGVLVPLAWAFTIAAHADIVTAHTLFMAHLVMTVLLAVFAVTGRKDMQSGVLNVWWWIIAVGFVVTLAGTVGFQVETGKNSLQALALGGWMVLPAVGFVYTGQRVSATPWPYFGGAGGCLAGLSVYVAGVLMSNQPVVLGGLALVGLGQTVGILDAVVRY
jgi:hypothetical protein